MNSPHKLSEGTESLPDALMERVLARLGLPRHPAPTLGTLRAISAAWCQRVPFDNVRKLILLRAGNARPLPGSSVVDSFEGWLRVGTGSTCRPGASALHALLTSLGFAATRGLGTMLVAPGLPPNHGTVLVTVEVAS